MMAEVLSDYIKSREEFERFCNIFLKKEVSPRVKVYNAPGPDGGIDAEYCGPYDGKNGCWIFQCKFYDPTRDKGKARSNLISVMKGDQRKKNKSGELDKANKLKCDHYILITNTSLTAGNVSKIRNIQNEKGYAFSLDFWDAEDLITITCGKFPYILKPPHLSVFLPWQDMFRNEFDLRYELLRHYYKTFGRGDEMARFQTFVRDENKRLLVVYGSGGIGKTKLAIDFAKMVEQDYEDWDALFVQVGVRNFGNALKDILPNKRYVFFIDEGHEFKDDFRNLIAVLDSEEYSESKAVLITRTPFKEFIKGFFLSTLPDGTVDELEVRGLSSEKTRELIQEYTEQQISVGNHSRHLTALGGDTPLIAVMVIDSLNKGVDLSALTKEEWVEKRFESYLPEKDNPRRKLLDWISAISPIDAVDGQICEKLAEILKVDPTEIDEYRADLIKDGLLVQTDHKQRISPDPLSDYILRKKCYLTHESAFPFHKHLLKEFLPILPVNVITNLARVENIAGEKSLLDEHIISLKNQAREGDKAIRMDILDQMEGICYFRPDDALEIFNIIIDNPNSKDTEIDDQLQGKCTLTHQVLAETIAWKAQKIGNYTLSRFRRTLEMTRKLILTRNLETLSYNSFEKLLTDLTRFQIDKSLLYQQEVLKTFEEWEKEDKQYLSLLLIHALNSLFKLDFHEFVSESEFVVRRLIYTPEIDKLITQAIIIVEKCLETSQHSIVRAKAIEFISNAIDHFLNPHVWKSIEEQERRGEQNKLFAIIDNQISNEFDGTVLNEMAKCLDKCAENSGRFEEDQKKKIEQLLKKFYAQGPYAQKLLAHVKSMCDCF